MTERKFVDCFIFFNELSTLNMRLHELSDCVDYFVIVESPLTHSGNKKPLYFNDNKASFKKFADKIIHVIDDGVPNKARGLGKLFQHRNAIEYHQRNFVIEAAGRVPGIKPTDIVMYSDVDEVPNPDYLKPELFDDEKIVMLNQRYFLYDFTTENIRGWPGTMCAPYQIFVDLNLNRMRKFKYRNRDGRVIYRPATVSRDEFAGWHCSTFGGIDRIVTKLESFAHQKYNRPEYKDKEKIRELIRDKKDLIFRNDEAHELKANDEESDVNLPKNWRLIYEEV